MFKVDMSEILKLLGFIDSVKTAVLSREETAVLKAGNAYAANVQRLAMVDTGQYRSSIRAELARGGEAAAVIGSPMPQTRRLEFGFHGPDSLGRVYSQGERPHWRAAWYPHLGEYLAIIEKELLKDVHLP